MATKNAKKGTRAGIFTKKIAGKKEYQRLAG